RGCVPWVYANAGARGYYRTEYAPENLRAMLPHLESSLSAPERLSLAGDEWALVQAGRHSIRDYLTLASGYSAEHSSGVLSTVNHGLAFTHEYLTSDTTRTQFEGYVRALFRPLFDELGFLPGTGDSDEQGELRAAVIGALGSTGADLEVVSRSRAALDSALAGGPRLDATLAGAIVRIAAEHGDANRYDRLASAAERAASPEEHYLYLFALTDFREPALIDRALQNALSPKLRSQDTALYLAQF